MARIQLFEVVAHAYRELVWLEIRFGSASQTPKVNVPQVRAKGETRTACSSSIYSLKMRNLALIFAFLTFQHAESLVRPRYFCPPEFVRLGNGCYYFSSFIASWQNAHFACRDLGAQLAVLDSRWEDATIRSYISRPEFARLERWIGGLYDWSTQQWRWGATGKPMNFYGFGVQNDDRLREWHCVYMDPEQTHKWNHKLCTRSLHYICELPLTKAINAQILQ